MRRAGLAAVSLCMIATRPIATSGMASAMAGGIEGKEDPEEQDHKYAGQKARRSAKQDLGVAEKPALIGKQPLRKISAPFRTRKKATHVASRASPICENAAPPGGGLIGGIIAQHDLALLSCPRIAHRTANRRVETIYCGV
jgi:hypothetical protein